MQPPSKKPLAQTQAASVASLALRQAYDPAKAALAVLIHAALTKLAACSPQGEQGHIAGSPEELFLALEKPAEALHGDFALPCFRFAKAFKLSPQLIAQKLQTSLQESNSPWLQRSEVVGAFLNIFVNQAYLAAQLLPQIFSGGYLDIGKKSQAKPERVMIEFSQPNTHKEFHIGHCRNVCLGDSLCRIFAFNGFDVIPANYIGDEGTHVAKCLWQVAQYQGPAPTENFSEWYGQHYVAANQALNNASPEDKLVYQAKISAILAEIEAKKGPFYDLWQKSRDECMLDFSEIYQWLGVKFDHIFYESDVSEDSQKIVDTYIQKGLFINSEGAYGIPMEAYGLGFFMARKSDGTSLYITKDVALAKRKFEDFAIDRSLYVVGSEQNFHFRQLFKALELIGFNQAKKCHHISYAHVTLPEGKISSRQGNAIPFSQLIVIIKSEIMTYLVKYQGLWSPAEIDDAAYKLTIAAIKYGMLHADPQKEIVFDAKSWTSFDGNSGPYLMYSYARTCSILRLCAEKGYSASTEHLNALQSPFEHELLRFLYDFNGIVADACESFKPSVIANYLFAMCKSFNRFYANLSVLNAAEDSERTARLALVAAFTQVLKQGLDLLGITPIERM